MELCSPGFTILSIEAENIREKTQPNFLLLGEEQNTNLGIFQST